MKKVNCYVPAGCIYLANKIALNCIDAIFSSFLFFWVVQKYSSEN